MQHLTSDPDVQLRPARRLRLWALLGGLMLTLCSGPALAQFTGIRLFVNQGPAGGLSLTGEGLISASLASPAVRPVGFGEGSATATVDYGLIRLGSVAPEGVSSGDARGEFFDRFSITDPGVPNGTFGVATFQVGVFGSLEALRAANASWDLSITVSGSAPLAPLHGQLSSTGLYSGDAFGVYTGSFRFRFGRQESLSVEAQCFASAARTGTPLVIGSGTCDLGHTITWGGITSIVPEGGFTLSGVVLNSSSGTNYLLPYTAPVPEPAGWALMAAGLALVAVRRRATARQAAAC